MARSTARKRALNTLYEADLKDADILDLLAEREKNPGADTPLPEYASDIVRGVAQHYKRINGMINEHASWKISRMAVVDRNILRMGVWEIVYNDEIPAPVAIDEALALAKKLSDADSPSFIHAVLSAISDDPNAVPENDDQSQRSRGLSRSLKQSETEITTADNTARDEQYGDSADEDVDLDNLSFSSLSDEERKPGTFSSLIPAAERRRRRAFVTLSRRRILLKARNAAWPFNPTNREQQQAEYLLQRAVIRMRRRGK